MNFCGVRTKLAPEVVCVRQPGHDGPHGGMVEWLSDEVPVTVVYACEAVFRNEVGATIGRCMKDARHRGFHRVVIRSDRQNLIVGFAGSDPFIEWPPA